jgi:hypothetical protein
MGVPKAERDVQPEQWPNGYDLPYEYPHAAVVGFRERVLKFYSPNNTVSSVMERCTPDPEHPRVVVTFRSSPKRHIVNKQELVGAMARWCPACRIAASDPENESLPSQLEFVCNASLLVGIHGGGLSHMLFQQPSTPAAPTAVIEILPFGYTCRPWYRWAAMTANVRYFHWINPFINNTLPYQGTVDHQCFTGGAECLSDECHDRLRDQLTTIDLSDFKHVFMKAVHYISKAAPFAEVDLANQTNETATVRH